VENSPISYPCYKYNKIYLNKAVSNLKSNLNFWDFDNKLATTVFFFFKVEIAPCAVIIFSTIANPKPVPPVCEFLAVPELE